MESNLQERDFHNEHDPGDLHPTSSNQQESHEVGGAPPPLGAPSTLMGPTLRHRRTPSSYIYPRTPKQSETEPKP